MGTNFKEYKAETVTNYNGNLAENTTKLCNSMLQQGYVYVGTIASVEQLSAVLLFAK